MFKLIIKLILQLCTTSIFTHGEFLSQYSFITSAYIGTKELRTQSCDDFVGEKLSKDAMENQGLIEQTDWRSIRKL